MVMWWCFVYQVLWLAFHFYSSWLMVKAVGEMSASVGQPPPTFFRFFFDLVWEGGVGNALMLVIASVVTLAVPIVISLSQRLGRRREHVFERIAHVGLFLTLIQATIELGDFVIRNWTE